jgi:ABC-type transport system substrate-binding protein
VVQADLGQIGIPVTVEVTPPAEWELPYFAGSSSYASALPVANQVAQISWLGSATFAPGAPTPADAWVLFVNQYTPANNDAIYANPTVQKCVDAWTATGDVTLLTNLCTAAQKQVYDDAPYLWLGTVKLAYGGGSLVWDNTVVKSLLLDPLFTSYSEMPIFNTVTFVNS